LVQDAMHCLDTLANLESVSEEELFILGHSEGCIIAPQVALQRPSVVGLVLLCPFIERLESVLVRQAAQLEMEIASIKGMSGFFYRLWFSLVGSPSAIQQRLIRKVLDTDSDIVRVGLSLH